MSLKSIVFTVVMVLALLISAGGGRTQMMFPPRDPLAPGDAPTSPQLQYRAGGHVLGFQPDKVILAALDHALSVAFEGGAGVTPVSSQAAPAAATGEVATAFRVTYPNVWPGIEVAYQATAEGVAESTYTLAPGASVEQIRLKYNTPATVQADGSLRFAFANGDLTESAPVAWQVIEGTRRPIEVAFAAGANGVIGFRLGRYDDRYAVTIDPVYAWHTFLGAPGGYDFGYAIATDADGNIYLAGRNDATWQGDNQAYPLHPHSGGVGYDLVVVKLDSTGAYQWHTFYGSADAYDQAHDLALDPAGNLYVTGSSSADWQGPGNVAPLHAFSGDYDVVVLKLNPNGQYQWHTFYGSNTATDQGYSLALDAGQNLYVGVRSAGTWSGPGNVAPLHAYSGGYDMAVLKLDSNGLYQWHTFYGSAGAIDYSQGLAAEPGGDVYLTGYSLAAWQGDNTASPLHPYTGGQDVVILKLTSAGAYQWHTFYGSNVNDLGYGLALDGSGGVYVSGTSYGAWQGDNAANPLHAFNGTQDVLVLKLTTGGAYQWHTFYGSSATGTSLAVSGNDLYITGSAGLGWLGDNNASPLHAYTNRSDTQVLKLTTAGAYQWHTFYGATSDDYGYDIALSANGDVAIGGYSYATWSGDGGALPLHAHSGGSNADLQLIKLTGAGAYQWHTFYGVTGSDDQGYAVATDDSGNIYVAGNSNASWRGPGQINPLHAHTGDGQTNLVVVKLNPQGNYVWHTFYGSPENYAYGYAIAVDGGGVYVAGNSYGDWSGNNTPEPLHGYNGYEDLFILKLNHAGAYQWHTFYGASAGSDYGRALALDADGNVYVSGYSTQLWTGDNAAAPIHAHVGSGSNLLVLKLSSAGAYQWHTFYGSVGNMGNALAVDGNHHVYVAGSSQSTWRGDANTPPLHAHNGGNVADLVVLKLTDMGAYQWHTFYGAAGSSESSTGLVVDGSGGVYISGLAAATWQGEGNASPLHAYTGNYDQVILKLDSAGAYQWHTFYGSTGIDYSGALALADNQQIYAVGYSYSAWQGDDLAFPLHPFSPGLNTFVLALNATGTYQWHTFYGAPSQTQALAVDRLGSLIVAGYSNYPWSGDDQTSPLHSYSGGTAYDLEVLKLAVPYSLTVTLAGAGAGTVTSLPAGINCGVACTTQFAADNLITLTATATPTSTFAGWSGGGCAGLGQCVVSLASPQDITATFALAGSVYSLTVNRTGTGAGTVTSLPAGINCGTACQAAFDAGTVVTLTASASPTATFAGWSGAGCGGLGQCMLTLDAAQTVTATFDRRYRLFLPVILR